MLCSKREVFCLHFLKLNCLGAALLTSTEYMPSSEGSLCAHQPDRGDTAWGPGAHVQGQT